MTLYQKINNKIDYLERVDLESPTGQELSRWCSDHITWGYKWRKLTEEEMTELTARMINLFEGNY